METLVEYQRKCHEERECLVEAMTRENLRTKSTCRDQVISDNVVALLLERYQDITTKLADCYEDKDGSRYDELKSLGGEQQFSEFYVKIKQLRERSNKPSVVDNKHLQIAVPVQVEIERHVQALTEADSGIVTFSDEECWGRCLDLINLHQQYIQIVKSEPSLNYITYIQKFTQLYDLLSQKQKLAMYSAYKTYLNQIVSYLGGFLKRIQPLECLMTNEQRMRDHETRFEDQWSSGTFPGWTKAVQKREKVLSDLQSISRVEELASLGLDGLKQALLSLGLKCGGTLQERANRLWDALTDIHNQQTDTTTPETKRATELVQYKFKSNLKSDDRAKTLAKLESEVYRLSEELESQRLNTIENVQRKQARAGSIGGSGAGDEYDETDEAALLGTGGISSTGMGDFVDSMMTNDGDGEDGDDDDSDDVGRSNIYNPKNLPLGWDGKPIPYWLYKLHGLNIYYNCEICGNFKYRGPKAFQRHFAEWRHAHGMRCLGIPNTAHFANITLIEDAVALWDRLRRKKESEHWKPDVDEEFEDSSGNVVTRKVYEDLKRQGLL